MSQIDYFGRSVDDLGVRIPAHPPIHCDSTYGVSFPGKRTGTRGMPFSDPAVENIDVDKDPNADMLVLMPGSFDDSD